jgi:hypothetical protein
MTSFRLFTHINRAEGRKVLGYTGYIDGPSSRHFTGDDLAHRFVRAMGELRAVPMKEILESFEFFAAVRREVRREVVIDLCAGHGLVGVLFALYEREVKQVWLVDWRPPASRERVLEAAASVGPWVREKIQLHDRKIETLDGELPVGAAMVSVHACGHRTDRCLDLGMQSGGPMAVMPCCRSKRKSTSSQAVAQHLGHDLAIDIDRTYRLEAAGYHVRWGAIPEVITPQNRVLIGRPKAHQAAASNP